MNIFDFISEPNNSSGSEPEQACYQFFIFDIEDQPPIPPKVKLRKSENKLFKKDEELFFGDDQSSESKYISVKSILESIHIDASKLDLSEA